MAKDKKMLPENEDKQHICDLLLSALQATRSLYDLTDLNYVEEKEIVIARFDNGFTKVVNVDCDSGMWRSLVARFAGGEEVASSNLAIPTTNIKEERGTPWHLLTISSH